VTSPGTCPGSDDDVYPDMWDSTFYASLAEAPRFRLLDMTAEDVAARRAFWRWWLTEAVPGVARDHGIGAAG